MCLQNIGSCTDYMALYPRRWQRSYALWCLVFIIHINIKSSNFWCLRHIVSVWSGCSQRCTEWHALEHVLISWLSTVTTLNVLPQDLNSTASLQVSAKENIHWS
jgi:hypothetical protein